MSSRQERFTELFDRTHPALLAYAVRRVADTQDAADIAAETFLVAWRRLDDVRGGGSVKRPHLTRTCSGVEIPALGGPS